VFVGLGRWWYALAGYRLGGLNASDPDWSRFGITSRIAAPTILPLVAASAAGLAVWLARNRRIARSTVLLPAWVFFACLGFMTGGLFHRHYWVTLTFPLSAAAAVAIAKINGRMLMAATTLVAIPSLISTAQVVVLGRDEVAVEANADWRISINERIGDWYIAHRTSRSTLYSMCSSAALYANADAIPPYPYLWFDGVLHGKGAQDQLVQLFSGDNPPTFVAGYQDARTCNPSGRVEVLLKARYTPEATYDGVTIFRLRGATDEAADVG
jgi:hypothetical protein